MNGKLPGFPLISKPPRDDDPLEWVRLADSGIVAGLKRGILVFVLGIIVPKPPAWSLKYFFNTWNDNVSLNTSHR